MLLSTFSKQPKSCDFALRFLSSAVAEATRQTRADKIFKLSDSMKFYLKTKQDEVALMEREKVQYATGKRHLANIMGFDPDTVSAEQISQSIRYLFPSGLFDPKALPVMKPPEEIFPKIVKIDVDSSGAPKHSLFFTVKPKFYSLLSEISRRTQKLVSEYDKRQLQIANVENKHSDELSHFDGIPPEKRRLSLMGTQWLTMEQLQERLQEMINEDEYANFIIALEYITQLPNSEQEANFIMSMRRGIGAAEKSRLFRAIIPEVTQNKDGRRECLSICKVKTTKAETLVRDGGTGLYTVNGLHYCEFRSLIARECLLAPAIIAGKLGQVDVEARILEGPGGLSAIPRAVRQGVALGLAALFPETSERLRLAGLLSTDPRRRERSKINQKGARAKWIWKAR